MKRQSTMKTLAMLPLLAMGLGGIHQGNLAAKESKGAVLALPGKMSRKVADMLEAGGSPYRNRNPWPFRGKNRAQRQRLAAAFGNF